jgi:dihydropteroate synthase
MFTLNCNGRLLTADGPLVMGIINTTPDSFYGRSRKVTEPEIVKEAESMLKEGADILDIGAQSTRPGSTLISADEELNRVINGITAIHERFPDAIISTDTWYSKVAREAVAAGAGIVNDISGGLLDKDMLATVASLNVPYVLMHMIGTPQTMQQSPTYSDVTGEVLDFLIRRTREVANSGIKDIIIDPGFGFGKTIAHNFELLRNLSVFKIVGRPLLIGLSRKSTISKTLDITAEDSLNGTTVLNTVGLLNGADIIRVHDVKEAKEAVRLIQAYRQTT